MEEVFSTLSKLLNGFNMENNHLNGKELIIQFLLMVGVKKMAKNIGYYKTVGDRNGVKTETSESEEELMNLLLKVWLKLQIQLLKIIEDLISFKKKNYLYITLLLNKNHSYIKNDLILMIKNLNFKFIKKT